MLNEQKYKTAYLIQVEVEGIVASLENAALTVYDFQHLLDKAVVKLLHSNRKCFC
ncbi:hypothetical protein AAKU52_003227 [Pedobacter sp. CG_S7]|uniref:hypothetical protein n=1 Tax=Pedobacter sp. CG_S7 TaxID=3143930 RepID=UPI003399ABB7